MIKKIDLTKAIACIKKFEKKTCLKKSDLYIVNRHLKKLDLSCNVVKHYESRLERIKLRYLED